MDFTDHDHVIELLTKAQGAEDDMRELAKEAHLFVSKLDGQWEPEVITTFSDRPRYTFDQTSPIVDQVATRIEENDFDIKIEPAGDNATKELAELRDGMIRTIEMMSNASRVYSTAARDMVTSGISGWRVTTRFMDDKSFDQDIAIETIFNFQDRVWFDPNSHRQDRSDSEYGFLLSAIAKDTFDAEFPDKVGSSVSTGETANAYFDKIDQVVIGHLFFLKKTKRELVKMNDGAVYERDEEFDKIEDELKAKGIIVSDTRRKDKHTFWVRKFDANGWIEEAEETPFSQIPLVPIYGNFKFIENKPVYHGVVQKLMDPQRVMNYSLSREIEEGALAPRAKKWMTPEQAAGFEDEIATMNTNADPVQFYNHVDGQAVPFDTGGAAINPGLRNISTGMQQIMGATSGIFAAGMGDNPNAQSGIAIEKLQRKSGNVTVKYETSLEIGICQTGKLASDAIPIVYDTARVQKITKKDGTFDMALINGLEFDEETQSMVALNDLTVGKYSITCRAAPSFDSRQNETVASILEIATVDPSILDTSKDILLNNMNTPGSEQMAERARAQLFQAGVIPQNQLTEEELAAQAQAQAQPQEPDANMVLAQAEQAKADAQQQKNEVDIAKAQGEMALEAQRIDIDREKVALERQKAELDLAEKASKLNLSAEKQEFDREITILKEQFAALKSEVDNRNTEADTLKKLREASGADAILDPGVPIAFHNQTHEIIEGQL